MKLCLGAADANKLRELNRALMKAAQNKDARAVEALLKEGADPNAHHRNPGQPRRTRAAAGRGNDPVPTSGVSHCRGQPR